MSTAIVQARMSSTRLPGKVMKEVLGKPLLYYVLDRLKKVPEIRQIVVATTINKADDVIAQFCEASDIPVYRGSENDVLDRYYQAAKKFNADPIIRITADCPLLSTEVLQQLIREFEMGGYDLVSTGQSFAEGLDCEIFSMDLLRLVVRDASKLSEREHVTRYMHTHPEVCKKYVIENTTDDSAYRVVVDEPEDFLVVKAVIETLYPKNEYVTIHDVKRFLDEHPDVAARNKHITRNEGLSKSLAAETESV